MAQAALLMTVSAAVSCSVLLDHDVKQCKEDRDCSRFPDAVCNSNAGICIGRPSFPNVNDGSVDRSSAPTRDGAVPIGEASARDGDGASDGDAASHGGGGSPMAVGGVGGPTGPGCPDLNGNGVIDCKESLVINPDFKMGVEGWTPELDMRQGFSSTDGQAMGGSGSLAVINASQSEATTGWTMGGSKQCVRTTSPGNYELYLQTQLGAVSDVATAAGAVVQFYAAADCAGPTSGSFMPPLADTQMSGWRVSQGIVPVPAGTQSLLLRLVVLKPFKQPATQALFDNVLFKIR